MSNGEIKMSDVTEKIILERLAHVMAPDGRTDIVSAGLVSQIVIAGSKVTFALMVNPSEATRLEPMRSSAQQAVEELEGIDKVIVMLTAEKTGGQKASMASSQARPMGQKSRQPQFGLPGVGAIIAVASGKGGVGKSTVAVNLALALKGLGLKVGLLDADIYGPSIPRLTGLTITPAPGKPFPADPPRAYDMKVMSMGFLVHEDTPMIWRAPMVVSALTQMLRELHWAPLDVLIVDMPPGTGDIQLTMAQQVPLTGTVIVSTPQDLALIDARKGVAMFQKVNVPILGIVENMSYFLCPSCGERTNIFGHGGAQSDAVRIGVPFLGEVPLQMKIREASDAGQPIVATNPESQEAQIFHTIATKVWQSVEQTIKASKPAPDIVIE